MKLPSLPRPDRKGLRGSLSLKRRSRSQVGDSPSLEGASLPISGSADSTRVSPLGNELPSMCNELLKAAFFSETFSSSSAAFSLSLATPSLKPLLATFSSTSLVMPLVRASSIWDRALARPALSLPLKLSIFCKSPQNIILPRVTCYL